MFENEFGERILDFTNYDLGVSSKKNWKGRKTKHSRAHSSTCVSLREKGLKDEGRMRVGVNRTWTDDVQCMFYP